MQLIDKEALMHEYYNKPSYKHLCHAINAAPVIDVPNVIRCRECKHWDKTWSSVWRPGEHYCPMLDGHFDGNFYCADAEPIEKEGT